MKLPNAENAVVDIAKLRDYVPDHDVQRVIHQNRQKKEACSLLLTELERSLKRQVRNPAP